MEHPHRARRPPGPAQPQAAQATAASPDVRSGGAARFLALQRTAGNQATSVLVARVGGAAGEVAVQRYDAFEHAGTGDTAAGSSTFTIRGVELTSGEVNALADLYGSLADLKSADPAELRRCVDLVRKQRKDPKSVAESDWDAATGGRYNRLNLANSRHFAPVGPPPAGTGTPGPDHRQTWESYYRAALQQARFAQQAQHQPGGGPAAAAARQEARLQNSFGEHYLMDAFSAGHLFNKDQVLATLTARLGALTPKEVEALLGAVATGVWAAKSAVIKTYQGPKYRMWWDLHSADRFQAVLSGVYADPDGRAALQSAVVKSAHDTLSADMVEVSNAFATWKLSGDRTLASSPDTQAQMSKAVEVGRKRVETVATTRMADVDDAQVAAVLAHFPKPTAPAQKIIDELLAQVTDPKGKLVPAITAVAAGEIEALLEAIAAKGKIRKKP